jgi:hypothetical protein
MKKENKRGESGEEPDKEEEITSDSVHNASASGDGSIGPNETPLPELKTDEKQKKEPPY